MKSSLIFSSHNFVKILLQTVEDQPQNIQEIITRVDNKFNVHWWQKRSKNRKIEYLGKRIRRLEKKKYIELVEDEEYLLTPRGRESLTKTEERDQKLSHILKNLIKPTTAFFISTLTLILLITVNFYGFSISKNPIFALEGILLILMSLNFYQILMAPRNPIRRLSSRIFRISLSIIGVGVMIYGLTIFNSGIITYNLERTGMIVIIDITLALISFLVIYCSGYLNENVDVKVLALHHRNTIFSSLFVVISAVSMDLNIKYATGLIIIIYGINILSETRKSSYDHFTHHILILLNSRPHTYEEMLTLDNRIAMLFGAAMFFRENLDPEHLWINYHGIRFLQIEGLVREEGGLFHLTEKAIPRADRQAQKMVRFFTAIKSLAQPSISPLLSLVIHLVLASLKLFGFVLTGSVGLLGDGIDSAIDGVSSIIVTIAMWIKRETEATYLLIILMAVSGVGILVSSITRIMDPTPIAEGNFGVLVAVISIIACFLLYIYQKYSGYINRSLTILAQSEDSKNHVLNASLVLLAIAASEFQIYIIDGFVGCFIGFLVLRGAYEIFTDLRSYNKGDEINFGKYKLGLWKSFNRFQYRMLQKWVLYQIFKNYNTTEMIQERFSLDFQPIVIKESHGKPFLIKFGYKEEDIKQALKELEIKKLVQMNQNVYSLSEEGEEQVRKGKARYNR